MKTRAARRRASTLLPDDFVLVATGALRMRGFGAAAAATFDGAAWTPLLLATTAGGAPAAVAAIFSQREQPFSKPPKHLATGYVVLIALALALALVFLLVAAGVAASYVRRRREGYVPAPTMGGAEKTAQMQDRLPPGELLHGMGARGRGAPAL